jgi:hypothetical protein
LIAAGAGAALLTQADAGSPYAAWVLPGLILLGTGIGSALGVALISTFVATATHHYLTHHGSTAVVDATVHGFTVGFWWAAGLFWAAAVICGA